MAAPSLCLVLSALLPLVLGDSDPLLLGQFPQGFAFGVATSAYQIEGAWKEDGKGESIWDRFTHQNGTVKNGDKADVAVDHYHRYKEDIGLAKFLGVTHFRISLAWTRLMPDGTRRTRNQKGIDHYRDVLREIVAQGITPVVTLYVWDLPQALEDQGGWRNPAIVQYFEDYAKLCFQEFGDVVKMWVTFVEPWVISWMGHEQGSYAPGLKQTNGTAYIVGHHVLLAHAHAYRVYEREFRNVQKGKVGISLDSPWKEPKTSRPADVAAADRAMSFRLGWFADPLIKGDYPQVMKDIIARKSRTQGFSRSRLPEFTEEEKQVVRGSLDFLGINHYFTHLVSDQTNPNSAPGFFEDMDALSTSNPSTNGREPWGMRKLLNYLRTHYNNIEVFVTENGVSDCGSMEDQERIDYIRGYTNNVLKAIQDGCNVKGYILWTLVESYEWSEGYSIKFALFYVDRSQPELPRFPRASAYFYRHLIAQRGFTPSVRDFRAYPADRHTFLYDTFPQDFHWAVATASYQVEGGWNEDGKGPSIWDVFAHQNRIIYGQTGDVACDSYHLYKRDVQMLKYLGVSHYRFSIAWSRIMPDGTPASLNAKGVAYYNALIDELLAHGVQPMVTLYHWDLPQALQLQGGWQNASIAQRFRDYAQVCFEQFGNRVKLWITFNEPYSVTWLGFGIGIFAPGISDPGQAVYTVTHNIIRSHTMAYHTYDRFFRSKYHGQVGITLDIEWKEPLTLSQQDAYAAERAMQFKLGWFANALLATGDYPEVVRRQVAAKSLAQGLNVSRLPQFTEEEKRLNKNAYDFLGINHYTTNLVSDHSVPNSPPNFELDQDIEIRADMCWKSSSADWLRKVPWGIRRVLNFVRDRYGNPPVYVTESGFADRGGMQDDDRIDYYRNYINELLKAIRLDGCNVKGYTAWSLMDNLEWASGYTQKFGLFHVNFTDPARTRTPKASANFFRDLVRDNGFIRH